MKRFNFLFILAAIMLCALCGNIRIYSEEPEEQVKVKDTIAVSLKYGDFVVSKKAKLFFKKDGIVLPDKFKTIFVTIENISNNPIEYRLAYGDFPAPLKLYLYDQNDRQIPFIMSVIAPRLVRDKKVVTIHVGEQKVYEYFVSGFSNNRNTSKIAVVKATWSNYKLRGDYVIAKPIRVSFSEDGKFPTLSHEEEENLKRMERRIELTRKGLKVYSDGLKAALPGRESILSMREAKEIGAKK